MRGAPAQTPAPNPPPAPGPPPRRQRPRHPRSKPRLRATTALLALALPLLAHATAHAGPAGDLHALLDREWTRTLSEHPTWASRLGDRRWNRQWDDLSLARFQERHARDRQALADLERIDREALPASDQRNLDLFRLDLQLRIEAFPHGWHLVPIDHLGGLQTDGELADILRFESVPDFEDWIGRLRAFGTYADQAITLLREGIRRGRLHPRVAMQRLQAHLDRQIVDDPAASPFFRPCLRFPAGISGADRTRLAAEAASAIREHVLPAFRRFRTFFNEEYLPACPSTPGVGDLPGGRELYAFLVRRSTTTPLTPDAIHELGLREVARIRERMEEVRQSAGFQGTIPEYLHHLRTDPRYFHTSPLELLAAYQVVAKRIDPTLVRLFRTLPRTPYGVEPIPDAIAPDTTTAYYRPPAADGSRAGTFCVNLFRPETRPKWEMMALALHEAVPGHHLQIALSQEQTSLPAFRRHASHTAYVEGWALYAESLGHELGLYHTPEERMGALAYEMWRAVRLVVDTGLHHRGWDRDRAIAYFLENTPKPRLDVTNEVDRYIVWPGQALAYKIGELRLRELRSRAERELGSAFDLRAFHETVLSQGAVPLEFLEKQVSDWIAATRPARRPAPGQAP